ncbi:MAG: transposase [Methylotenera sp.]|nr:transposase [Flavobacterium sp.]
MQQVYHSNAKTNVNIRQKIQTKLSSTNEELSAQFGTSTQTISKWRNRDFTTDASCAPNNIVYALSDIETVLAISLRSSTWFALDEIFETLLLQNNTISRSAVYRCFVRNGINKVPVTEKEKAKKFKAYEPGYLHFDVTYMPKFNKVGSYLYVAIDRATRTMYYKVYDNKTAENTDLFFDNCMAFFPFNITHILTDNGFEFTNRLIKSKKGNLCTKPSLLDVKCTANSIEHRCTQPSTPKTNGMVERVNGTIKNNTILKYKYNNKTALEKDLMDFLVFYNLYRRHGSLRKELNVKTPFDAVEKWYLLKPELFLQNPCEFKNEILNLNAQVINMTSTML